MFHIPLRTRRTRMKLLSRCMPGKRRPWQLTQPQPSRARISRYRLSSLSYPPARTPESEFIKQIIPMLTNPFYIFPVQNAKRTAARRSVPILVVGSSWEKGSIPPSLPSGVIPHLMLTALETLLLLHRMFAGSFVLEFACHIVFGPFCRHWLRMGSGDQGIPVARQKAEVRHLDTAEKHTQRRARRIFRPAGERGEGL